MDGDEEGARRLVLDALAAGPGAAKPGEVWLVGAGPGDPELLTLRALRALQRADTVVYDRLVAPEILAFVRPGAESIDVGKAPRAHSCEQNAFHELLIRQALRGKLVVRLKGGDPLVFGRGGEEVGSLTGAGISVHVVPGISAANGCAAYAGIALTHRDCAHSVTFVVAHQRETAPLDWPVLARPAETLVFFMPLSSLERISRELMLRGLPPSHPAALVAEDTTPRQRVWETTLAGLPALAATSIRSPALLIVGQVVRLRVQRKSPGPTSLLMRDSEWCSPVRTQGYG